VPEGLQQREIEEAIKTLSRWQKRLIIHYQPSWNVLDVEKSARELQGAGRKIGGIFVDYIQLVAPPPGSYESLEHEVTATAKHLKRLGVDLSCPVIAAAQIGREAADIAGWIPEGDIEDERVVRTIAKRRPQLHHLRQGGGEQEADLVVGLLNYRADYIAALEDNEDNRQRLEAVGTSGQFDVAVIKNRYGVLGIAPLVLESHSGYVRDPGVFGR
jgi:replicative DNA helicase